MIPFTPFENNLRPGETLKHFKSRLKKNLSKTKTNPLV
jgi:hypothetical protein